MTSRRGGGTGVFRFFCLCVLLVAMIDGSCRFVCFVSRFVRRLVLFVLFFFLIVIGAGGGESGGAGDDEGVPFYPARFLLFAVSVLMFATVIASMMRMREGETIGNDNGENETRGWGKM